MLDALKFVQGAVAKRDFVPALTHFNIKAGRIYGFNGRMALSSPIELDIECTPQAVPFVRAIQACDETVTLHLTPKGRLSIQSGGFKAFINCTTDEFPAVTPEGAGVEINDNFLAQLEMLLPFVAEDASRPWAMGILFRGTSVYATNNIVLVERWLGEAFPAQINVPKFAIQELLRIGIPPIGMQVTDADVTFHYPGGRWMKTQTYGLEWPAVDRLLGDTREGVTKIPPTLAVALETLAPFTDVADRAFLARDRVATSLEEGEGASIAVEGLEVEGCYNHTHLLRVLGVADQWGRTERGVTFYGDKLRGFMIGMRG